MDDMSDECLRLNRMTECAFNAGSIKELKFAVQDLLELFYDIVVDPITTYSELRSRLKHVRDSMWDRIRCKYLESDSLGYCQGDFSDNEKNSVVKILFDFLAMLDKCSKTVLAKVEEKQEEMRVLELKVKTMEERIRKMDAVIESQKSFYTEKVSENTDLAAQNLHLLQQIGEKNKQITELERTNNVHLWEKEKQKLLKESTDKISELEKEIKDLKQHNDHFKERISSMGTSVKQLRMQHQLESERTHSPGPLSDEDVNNKVQLSQKNFLQDKDIVYLEKKLYDLQTTTCGVIGGIKTDFKQLAHKFIDPEEGHVDDQFKVLSQRMDRVYKAVAEAEVEKVKEVLPPHYRYIEDEGFKVKRIRRLSTPVTTPPFQKVQNNVLDERKPVLRPIPPSLERLPTLNSIKEVSSNPEIIDPVTKRLHPINPLKYFPFMSQQFVKDQYEKFKEYDKNGDGTLDLSEMVDIVKTLGFEFNIHQLQEAMEEVDRDNNQCLDFFEYMLIIDNIYRKRGKAELFQQGMKEVRRNNMSKSCTIQ